MYNLNKDPDNKATNSSIKTDNTTSLVLMIVGIVLFMFFIYAFLLDDIGTAPKINNQHSIKTPKKPVGLNTTDSINKSDNKSDNNFEPVYIDQHQRKYITQQDLNHYGQKVLSNIIDAEPCGSNAAPVNIRYFDYGIPGNAIVTCSNGTKADCSIINSNEVSCTIRTNKII